MSIGLIIEGGGMRGIFCAGVLDFFMDHDIRFRNVLAVSAGACNAVSYVCNQRGRAWVTSTDYLDNPEFCSLKSLRKTGDMFGADFLYHKIPEELYPIDNKTFLESGIKFQPVITNCITGKPEYPVMKDLSKDMEYIRASSSLPILANMVPLDGYVYMDGGITDSIPIKQSIRQGNKKNVVLLTRPLGYRKNPFQPLTPLFRTVYRRYPRMLEALKNRNRVYNDTLEFLEMEVEDGNVFAIAPMGDLGIGRTETNVEKLKKGYEEGYYVAEGLAKKLAAFMAEAEEDAGGAGAVGAEAPEEAASASSAETGAGPEEI